MSKIARPPRLTVRFAPIEKGTRGELLAWQGLFSELGVRQAAERELEEAAE